MNTAYNLRTTEKALEIVNLSKDCAKSNLNFSHKKQSLSLLEQLQRYMSGFCLYDIFPRSQGQYTVASAL